jgi:hypothetical protein
MHIKLTFVKFVHTILDEVGVDGEFGKYCTLTLAITLESISYGMLFASG